MNLVRPFFVWALMSAAALSQNVAAGTTSRTAQKQIPTATPVPHFEDIAQQAGLTVSHVSSPAARYIIESVSGGVGLIDCDNDGKLDIVTVNGSNVERYRQQGGDPMI